MSGNRPEAESFAAAAQVECDRLAQGFAHLVNEIHSRELLPELEATATSLAERCQEHGRLAQAQLALVLACGCRHLFAGEVDPGQALPLLAAGTETLFKSITARDRSSTTSQDALGLRAAGYELETLFPIPGEEPKPNKAGPDVNLQRLRRRKDTQD